MGQLRDKMEQDLKLRRYRPKTATEYLRWTSLFAAHCPRWPLKLGEAELREFLLYQLDRKKVGPASHKMAVAALKFFYEGDTGGGLRSRSRSRGLGCPTVKPRSNSSCRRSKAVLIR